MDKVTEALIITTRQMHARLASINDIEEIMESVREDVSLPEDQKALVRKEIR